MEFKEFKGVKDNSLSASFLEFSRLGHSSLTPLTPLTPPIRGIFVCLIFCFPSLWNVCRVVFLKCEIRRNLSLEVFVIVLHFRHLLLHVSVWNYGFPADDDFFLEVNAVE